jgi:hypothetical protein
MIPSLGRHSRPPLRHCEHSGFCSSPASSVSREAGRQNREGENTFKLPSPTCQAGLVSRGACRQRKEAYHPVRDRIPGDVGATWGCGLSGGGKETWRLAGRRSGAPGEIGPHNNSSSSHHHPQQQHITQHTTWILILLSSGNRSLHSTTTCHLNRHPTEYYQEQPGRSLVGLPCDPTNQPTPQHPR